MVLTIYVIPFDVIYLLHTLAQIGGIENELKVLPQHDNPVGSDWSIHRVMPIMKRKKVTGLFKS